jgi:cytoskeletal protein CcmA (bactofilin family)
MRTIRLALFGAVAASLVGCGGAGSSTAGSAAAASAAPAASAVASSPASSPAASPATVPAPTSNAQVSVPLTLASDGASRNWAQVAVRILSVSLTPTNGASPITVYTASAATPPINLEQLDRISQLIGTVSPPPGTYTGAIVTVAANPGDVALTSSDDPQSGFAGPLGASIPAQTIEVQDSQGSTGNESVTVPVTFASPYVVSATPGVQAPLQLQVSLLNPAFVQSQAPVTPDQTLWSVDFQGAVSGQSIYDITSLVLRQMYGTLGAVAADGKSITITRDYPTQPAVSPETAVATADPLTILADSGNGTEFHDLDAGSSMTISNFAALAGLAPGRFLRISARYQADGSLVATQIWASDSFSSVWSGPEGHVTQVNASDGTLKVEDASGKPVEVQTDASTEFDYDGVPIATGSAFLATGPVVRGFQVRVTPRNPDSGQILAQSIDIESAQFWGAISHTTATGFTYTSQFSRSSDNYTLALGYISPSTPNGTAADGTPITGYAYWNFAYPTEVVYGNQAAADFQLATTGSLTAYGVSLATWNDPAAPSAWGLRSTTLLPSPLGLATVTTGLVSSGYTASFSLTPLGASAPITVQLITASGSAPLVYEAHRDHNDLTLTPLDITTSSGLSQLAEALQPGTYVNVFGLPKSSGVVQAYTLLYYTGIDPRQVAPYSGDSCNGTFTGLFAGTIKVTPGQDCILSSGATLKGNIQVEGGTLELSGATVKGQITVQGGGTVSILPSTLIEGNLQIEDLPAGSAPIQICGATIDGNLQYQDNAAPVTIGAPPGCAADTIRGNLQVSGNSASTVISGDDVNGNLQVTDNTGPSTQVSGNVVGQNLQCQNNASITGAGNSARAKQGQCESL